MDDELQLLEAELKRLQPAPPPLALGRRIERELAAPPAGGRLAEVHWLWAALPAAAAVALVFTQFARDRPADTARAGASELAPMRAADAARAAAVPLKPVTAEKILVAAADEGLVTLADGTPARRERLQFVDTIVWQHPQTNASLTWQVPREEVRLVPVSFQ